MTPQITRLNPFTEHSLVQDVWLTLEKDNKVSFFNSWGWVSTWLQCLPSDTKLEFIVVYQDQQPVCCFFLGIKRAIEHKIFYKNRAYLNSTGHDKYDEIVVEYNNFLGSKTYIKQHLSAILAQLSDIEEFRLPIASDISFAGLENFYLRRLEHSAYWVDLTSFTTASEYLSLLSKNRRNQINRSLKAYGGQAAIKLQFATSAQQALAMLEKLAALHQKEWLKRGKSGAFSRPFFKEFHHALIQNRFNHGEIQLIRVYTPSEDIGYLYNFTFNNQVLFYQSGFSYKSDNHFRPGLVAHYLAIVANMEKNFSCYNFLAGNSQYKQSLATNNDQLASLIITRKSMKAHVEKVLRLILKK